MPAKKSTKAKEPQTMEELLASSKSKIKTFRKLQKVDATLKSVGKKQATFDIGGKGDAVVEGDAFIEAKAFIKKLNIGDTVRALVLDPENSEGTTLLSLRHAANEDFWNRMEEYYKSEKIIEVTGQTATGYGLMVAVEHETAFIPSSQFSDVAPDNLEELEGERIKVKIIDLDREKNRIVLSERAVTEAEDIKRTSDALKAVKKGEVYEGRVTTVVSFGAFVEINVKVGNRPAQAGKTTPIEGLVHVSELSWGKIDTPEEVISEGDIVKVVVIGSDRGKLALSVRQAQEDPWKGIDEKYHSDDRVKGKIVRISDFGVFVELEPGIEGLIHMTKIPPGTALKEGQSVNCYIEEVNEKQRKIALGLVLTTAKPVGYR